MERGVYGEHGVHVQRHVMMEYGNGIDHVTIQHLHTVVPIAKDPQMQQQHAIQHARVLVQ